MADFLDEKRKEIDARLRELKPLVDGTGCLEKAAAALSGVGATDKPARRRSRGSGGGRRGRPVAAATGPSRRWSWCGPGPGSPSRDGGRDGHPTQLPYRVMPTLESEGQVVKRDGGFHPS